ncbi:polysaccharide pyruvyl transferase family protein [Weissella confusa]|uniref:polysaccharide pyruvyl transferase family protein n=1 Tax=Weissella confusa TaxID=1583 RepID=UPI0022E5EB14|nr:polysaccharide pyruvyl transferase family protein [Weissella confusa]
MVEIKYVVHKSIYKFGYQKAKLQRFNKFESSTGRRFLIGGVEYGNYGDHAINLGEYEWFKRQNTPFIEIPESEISDFISHGQGRFSVDDEFYFQGGGNMGDLWPQQEMWRQDLIEAFPENKIVIFPQSVNYDPTDNTLLNRTIAVSAKAKNLTILLRDKRSYEFVKDHFPNSVNVCLVPDMVLTLKGQNSNKRTIDVGLLMRSDKELVNDDVKNQFVRDLLNSKSYSVSQSDTVTKYMHYVTKKDRAKFLQKKLDEVGNSKVVVTDRLHGMIFALITSTPVIVFDNSTHKIKNLIETWLADFDNIYFVDETDSTNNLHEILDSFVNNSAKKTYSQSEEFARVLDGAF